MSSQMLSKIVDFFKDSGKKPSSKKLVTPYKSEVSRDIERYGRILAFDKPFKSYKSDSFFTGDRGEEIEVIGYEKQQKLKI